MVKKLPVPVAVGAIAERLLRDDMLALHVANQELVIALIADLQATGLTSAARIAARLESVLDAAGQDGGLHRMPHIAPIVLGRLLETADPSPPEAGEPPQPR